MCAHVHVRVHACACMRACPLVSTVPPRKARAEGTGKRVRVHVRVCVYVPGQACLHMKVAACSGGLYHLLYDLIWRVPRPPFPTARALRCQGRGLRLSALAAQQAGGNSPKKGNVLRPDKPGICMSVCRDTAISED